MRTPVVLVTGVDPTAMAAVAVGLQWDLPNVVTVHHRIDPERQLLHRVVSDVTGVLEREEIELAHACVSCAIREDVVPTIERCARDGRWKTVIAQLPVGAEGNQVCTVVEMDARLGRHLRIAGVVAALDGTNLVADLLGDALLRERGLHSSADDARGVGEVACAQIEYADLVVVAGGADTVARDLVRTLARPDAVVALGAENVDGAALVARSHAHAPAVTWVDPAFDGALPGVASSDVWQVDLRSPRAFHPGRLLAGLDAIGAGEHRSRGCFWLPTRRGRTLVWAGAGGQVSVGTGRPWAARAPFTRIVLTGVGEPPAGLEEAFEHLLLGPDLEGRAWQVETDGFEPWLGSIRDLDLPA